MGPVIRYLMISAALLVSVQAASAQPDEAAFTACKKISADADRLKCFDHLGDKPDVPASSPGGRESGWWIIVGSVLLGKDNSITKDTMRRQGLIEKSAAKCGFQTFADLSRKFEGMTPGYNAVVLGPWTSKSAAEEKLKSLHPCVSDSYVKQTTYAGE